MSDFLSRLFGVELPKVPRHDIELPQEFPVKIRSKKVGFDQPQEVLREIGLAGQSLAINPKLAGALALAENHNNYGMSQGLPQEIENAPYDVRQQAMAEMALRHLRERASAVGGSLPRQIQAYNGMGKLSPGYYGSNRTINAGKELPYGKRVLEYLRAIVDADPQMQNSLLSSRGMALSPMAGYDHFFADDIIKDMNIRQKKPNLLKEK